MSDKEKTEKYQNVTTRQVVEVPAGALDNQARWRKISGHEASLAADENGLVPFKIDGPPLAYLELVVEARTQKLIEENEARESVKLSEAEKSRLRTGVTDRLAEELHKAIRDVRDIANIAGARADASDHADRAIAAQDASDQSNAAAKLERDQAEKDALAAAKKSGVGAGQQRPDLEWNTDDIRAYAKENGIDLGNATKPETLIAKIQEHEENAAKEREQASGTPASAQK